MRGIVVFVLCLLVTMPASSQSLLTLEDALDLIDNHRDVESWQMSVEKNQSDVEEILDKYSLRAEISNGQNGIIRYTYELDESSGKLTVAPRAILSQEIISGFNWRAELSPTRELTEPSGDWNVGWSVSVGQSIWPKPSLSADSLSLASLGRSRGLLEQQESSTILAAKLHVEQLYREAQLAASRVKFGEQNLALEKETAATAQERFNLGEASQLDMVASEISLLRAYKELESVQVSSERAIRRLLDAIGLEGDYFLERVALDALDERNGVGSPVPIEKLIAVHPHLLQAEANVRQQELALEAAEMQAKPGISANASVSDAPSGPIVAAYLSINYSLLDGNQSYKQIELRKDALEAARIEYEDVYQNLYNAFDEALWEIKGLERDREIARLTYEKAKIEEEIAAQQYASGLIDQRSYSSYKLGYEQAVLGYYEASIELNLANRRLAAGLVDDYTDGGGQ